MSWLAIVTVLVKLALSLTEFFSRRQLLQAGEAQALADGLKATLAAVEKVKHARDRIDADPAERDSLRDRYTKPDDD